MKIALVLFAVLLAGCGSYPVQQPVWSDVRTRTICDMAGNCRSHYQEVITAVVPNPVPTTTTTTIFFGTVYQPYLQQYAPLPTNNSYRCCGHRWWRY